MLRAGPATNICQMTVFGKTMGRKSLTVYLATIIGGAVFFGILTNWLFPPDFFLSKIVHIHDTNHEMLPYWLQLSSALILILTITGGFFYTRYRKSEKIKKTKGMTVKVSGMTCSHCETSVKNNLEKIPGIAAVVADNNSGTVKISGKNINLQKVKQTINNLGYTFIE